MPCYGRSTPVSPNIPAAWSYRPRTCTNSACSTVPESRVPLDLDALWESNHALAVGLALVLLAPRFLGTPVAHEKRELLLPWLARKLPEIEDLDLLPTGILHDAYMHCSYADRADKHDIKRSINELIRRKLESKGIYPLKPPPPAVRGRKARPAGRPGVVQRFPFDLPDPFTHPGSRARQVPCRRHGPELRRQGRPRGVRRVHRRSRRGRSTSS